jgi:hypothetical protein
MHAYVVKYHIHTPVYILRDADFNGNNIPTCKVYMRTRLSRTHTFVTRLSHVSQEIELHSNSITARMGVHMYKHTQTHTNMQTHTNTRKQANTHMHTHTNKHTQTENTHTRY